MVKPLSFALPKDFAGRSKEGKIITFKKKEGNDMVKRRRTLFFPPKSKKLAKIISIKSPAAFRRSVRVLSRDGLTVIEKRALVLAKNRAGAMLKRVDLSVKERREMGIISRVRLPKIVSRFTSFNAGHVHKWRPNGKFTSFSRVAGRHRHRVSRGRGLALPAGIGGHVHRLLRR